MLDNSDLSKSKSTEQKNKTRSVTQMDYYWFVQWSSKINTNHQCHFLYSLRDYNPKSILTFSQLKASFLNNLNHSHNHNHNHKKNKRSNNNKRNNKNNKNNKRNRKNLSHNHNHKQNHNRFHSHNNRKSLTKLGLCPLRCRFQARQ